MSKIQILETRHAKKRYYLVFEDMEIKGKFETLDSATKLLKQILNENRKH